MTRWRVLADAALGHLEAAAQIMADAGEEPRGYYRGDESARWWGQELRRACKLRQRSACLWARALQQAHAQGDDEAQAWCSRGLRAAQGYEPLPVRAEAPEGSAELEEAWRKRRDLVALFRHARQQAKSRRHPYMTRGNRKDYRVSNPGPWADAIELLGYWMA